MKSKQTQIFEAVSRERTYQDGKYGTKKLPLKQWLRIIKAEVAEAEFELERGKDAKGLAELLQAMAVIVAAIEQHGLNEERRASHLVYVPWEVDAPEEPKP